MRKLKLPEPSRLDRAIAAVAPVWAARRAKARVDIAMSEARGAYIGARKDRRATQEWSASPGSADADLLGDLSTLRERSQDLYNNAPLATGAINTMVTNVVGTGLVPKARINRDVLRLNSDEVADAWEARAEWLYRLHALGPYGVDTTRELGEVDAQQLVLIGKLVRGDILCIRRFTEDDGGLIGHRWQFVEADRVSNPTGRRNSATLRDGVEKDAQGRVAGYHVQDQHPGDLTIGPTARTWTFVPAWSKDGTRMAFLIYGIKRPEQSRGIPILAPVIESFKQLDQYREAELMAAVISGMITYFIKTSSGEGLNVGPDPDGGPQGTAAGSELKLGYGAILDLGQDEEVQNPNPGRPNEAFAPFVEAILQQIGAALELPMSLLVKQFRASYSASRGELLEAWKAFKSMRFSLVQDYCVPSWEAVISEHIARGNLAAPGFFEDPEIRAAWLAHDWIGPSAGTLDPSKEVKAAVDAIDGHLSTRDRETVALNGGDWSADQRQRAKETARIAADGTKPPPPVTAQAAAADSTDPDKNAEDEEQN